MEAEKRKARSYKIADTPYYKALRKGWKKNTTLASILEEVATAYGEGKMIIIRDAKGITEYNVSQF